MQHVHVENITNQQVGARIADVRGAMKMTQAELASEMTARLGREIRPLTVTRLEGGKRPIGVDELVAAAEALRIQPADLLTVDGQTLVGTVDILSAFQTVVRACNKVIDAVRQYDSAQRELGDLLGGQHAVRYLDGLPPMTQVVVKQVGHKTVESLVAEARNETGGEDAKA